MTSRTLKQLMDSVRGRLVVERERGYRRALRHAGYMPRSIDLAVEGDREWIDSGKEQTR